MKQLLFFLGIATLTYKNTSAQGCSDAGVCSIHAVKNNTEKTVAGNKGKNDIVLGFGFGKGERHTSVYSPYVEYTRTITSRTALTGKLGFTAVTGELASTTGFSDLFLSVNHTFDIKSKWQKSFVAGVKIPFGQADIIKNGIHLPMPYQTSLGTTDIILALGVTHKSLGITAALQQPLNSTNNNKFLPQDYSSNAIAAKYLPTNAFGRKGDLLLRVSWNFNLNDALSIRPSLLSIYHLANDSYAANDKKSIEIAGSKGLTTNANIFFDYKLTKNSGLELSVGAPFIIRDKRPDGLTRSFVTSLDYRFNF